MKNTRHEEYPSFNNNLPFSLQIGLKRTPTLCSTSQNWHENLEFQFCTNGQGEVILDGQKYTFHQNDIIAINSNTIHYTGTSHYLEYTCLIISTDFCTQVGIDYNRLFFPPIIHDKEIEALFKDLQIVYQNIELNYRVAMLHEIVLKFIITICKKYASQQQHPKFDKKHFENVKKTIQFLRENYTRKLSLDEISHNTYCDKYVLSREFKKITGQTIVSYLNSYRCKKAAELIKDGVQVSEAAWRCGFDNISFFTKTFKYYMKELPSKYKNK